MNNIYSLLLMFLFLSVQIGARGQSLEGQVATSFERNGSLKNTSAYDLLRLKIKNPYLFDATVIYFHESFQKGIGPEDSEKMFNSSSLIPEIFTRVSDVNLAIDGFPLLNGASMELPICVRNRVYDECEIYASLEDFMPDYSVVLEDTETFKYTNLREGSYKYTPSALGICADRFVLHLSKGLLLATGINTPSNNGNENVVVKSGAGYLSIDIPSNWLPGFGGQAGIEVYNLTGKKIKELSAGGGNTQVYLPQGQLYLVRVVAEGQQVIKKVVVR